MAPIILWLPLALMGYLDQSASPYSQWFVLFDQAGKTHLEIGALHLEIMEPASLSWEPYTGILYSVTSCCPSNHS